MSLASVREILVDASSNAYGVAAFNIFNYESAKWAIKAAEAEKMPVIIQFYPGFTIHVSMKVIAESVKDLAAGSSVPVGLHLDHAKDFDTVMTGIRAGFASVMYDGSALPFDENAANTANIKRIAKSFGIDVEAELGKVGSGSRLDDFTNPNNFTDPSDVKRFVEMTDVDSLAISIGNGHGAYVKTPDIDLNRISAIKAETEIPLVLHGGSDIPDGQIQEAVRRGMSKFNIATEYQRAIDAAQKKSFAEAGEGATHFGLLRSIEGNVSGYIRAKIRLLNPGGYTL